LVSAEEGLWQPSSSLKGTKRIRYRPSKPTNYFQVTVALQCVYSGKPIKDRVEWLGNDLVQRERGLSKL